jgi:WXXGXW repeat (2 copies)
VATRRFWSKTAIRSAILLGVALTVSMGGGLLLARGQDPPPTPSPAPDAPDPQAGQAPAPGQADDQSPQVMTRGPIHEAFATPVVHDPAPGPVVPKDPPQPIEEMPPDQKPASQNIQWIPGYWSWDVTRNDWLWISGIWREPPPNTQWVPGYWNQVEGGHQWVPGTWVPVSTAQAQGQSQPSYLPPPPRSLEAGPNTPPPSANVAWTPGYWSWQGTQYAWRPGFYAAVQPNWVWMPAHYVWSPSGYLFVAGYWDHPVANRGLMFAPVYYPQPVYAQPGFVFTPSISIVGPSVTANLFVSAGTGQYMFGNFYGSGFVNVGITPWFSFAFATGRPAYYDPLFSYYAVINVRQNPMWITQVRAAYVERINNVALRPAATYIEQTRIIERNVTINRNVTVIDHTTIGMPLDKLAAHPGAGVRLQRVSAAERQQIRQQVAQLHQFREQRASQERLVARERAAGGAGANRPRPMNLPHSPIAARPAARAAESHAAAAQRAEDHRADAAHAADARRAEAAHTADAHRQEAARTAGGQRPEAQNRGMNGANARQAQTRTNQAPAARRPPARTSAAQSRSNRPGEEEERHRPE